MSGRPALLAALALAAALGATGARAAPPAQSWIKPKAAASLLLDIARHGERWVVVGERGHVLRSDDARRWTQVRVPTRVLLTAVALGAGGVGFAVGHEATILRTRDDGESWQQVYHAPDAQAPFLDVMITPDGTVVAVGGYGMYAVSRDGGTSWQRRTLAPQALAPATQAADDDFGYDYHLNAIAAADGRWYIAAEAGEVYRSDDGGETWRRLPSPYAGSFFGVLAISGREVLVFGLQGRLFRSTDGGASWTRVDTGTGATLSAGWRSPDGRVLIVGHAGTVLDRVTAAGPLRYRRLARRPSLTAVHPLGGGALLTTGAHGVRRWTAAELAGP